VLKGSAAAGVAAMVWAEPTIKGLARRPAYAETTSTGATVFTDHTIAGIDNGTGGVTILSVSPTLPSPGVLTGSATAPEITLGSGVFDVATGARDISPGTTVSVGTNLITLGGDLFSFGLGFEFTVGICINPT